MQRIEVRGENNLFVVVDGVGWHSEPTALKMSATLTGQLPSFSAGPVGPVGEGAFGPFALKVDGGAGTVEISGVVWDVVSVELGARTFEGPSGPVRLGGFQLTVVPHERTSRVVWERMSFVGGPEGTALLEAVQRQQPEPYTPESFTLAVLTALVDRYPDDTFETVAPLQITYCRLGVDGVLSLVDTWKAGAGEVGRLEQLIVDRVNLLSELAPTARRERVVAQVKHRDDAAARAQVTPVLVDELAGDAVILYAIDGDHGITQLAPEDLEALGIARDELPALVARNLLGLHDVVRIAGDPAQSHLMVVCGGNYEASMLLVPEVWEAIDPRLQGERVVAIPNRDLLLIADGARPDLVERIRAIAAEVHTNGAYPVVPHLLVHRGGRWERYEDPAPPPASKPWWRVW